MKRAKVQERRLPLGMLACNGCPYYANKKCEGETEATDESTYMNDDSVGGCLDTKRQIELFSDLQTLRPPKQIASHNSLNLPDVIFGINDGLKGFPPFNESDYFAVSFRNLIDEKGYFKYKSPVTLRNALKIPAKAPLAFLGTALDPRLEIFWHKSKIRDVWKRLAEFDFTFATSLSFSVCDNHPRFDQIFNRERNFVSHDLLLANGVNSIPFIFFYNDKDFEESVDWLNDRPDISVIAIHTQQLNQPQQILKLIRDMKALQQSIRRRIHFLVVGVFTQHKCASLKREFSNLTVTASRPLIMASNGEKLLSNLKAKKMPKNLDNTFLAVPNINTYKNFFASI
jgi:hypothetical protein